jgi:hypothetical protein
MLIAIMGETFTRVRESKERSSLMESTHLYADFMWAIRLTKELQNKRYLFVVRPVDVDEEEDVLDIIKEKVEILIEDSIEKSHKYGSEIQSLMTRI